MALDLFDTNILLVSNVQVEDDRPQVMDDLTVRS
jgi:hypothetical protein